MSNTETVHTTVRHLRAGDVLAGSGFVVTRAPQDFLARSTYDRTRIIVTGHYGNGVWTSRKWNRNTTVTVLRSI